MKKIFTILLVALTAVVGVKANLVPDGYSYVMSRTPLTSLSEIQTGTYILYAQVPNGPWLIQQNQNDNCFYRQSGISFGNSSQVAEKNIVKITTSTNSNNEIIATIQGYNEKYLCAVATNDAPTTYTDNQEAATKFTITLKNTDQSKNNISYSTFHFKVSSNLFLNAATDKLKTFTGNGDWSQYAIFPVTIQEISVEEARASLATALENANQYKIGSGSSKYTDPNAGGDGAFLTVLSQAQTMYDNNNSTANEYSTTTSKLKSATNALTLNMPTTATFYRFRSANSNGYLTSPAIGTSGQVSASKTDADETTIWFCTTSHEGKNNGIASYTAGEYIHPTQRNLTLTADWNGYDWLANTSTVGTYTIFNKSAGYKPLNSTEDGIVGNGTWNDNAETRQKQYAWYMEEVTSLPVSMHQSGNNYYATVCVPVATTVSGATAYYISGLSDDYATEGGYATLTEFDGGIIPANTAAILIGESSDVSLEVTEQAGTSVTSSLAGSFTATQPSTDNYYFGQKDGAAGFYAVTNIPSGKYISNTAWIAGSSASSSKGFTFVFGDDDPTGINNATAENAIKTKGQRYNVQGQRVGEGYKGIVIINGKKYLIK